MEFLSMSEPQMWPREVSRQGFAPYLLILFRADELVKVVTGLKENQMMGRKLMSATFLVVKGRLSRGVCG
jgi:hypothetical protein